MIKSLLEDLERLKEKSAALQEAGAELNRASAKADAEREELLESFLQYTDLISLREKAELSQKAVADMARVPQSYVSWLEAGTTGRCGQEATLRLLRVYMSLETESQDGPGANGELRQESGVQDVQGSRDGEHRR